MSKETNQQESSNVLDEISKNGAPKQANQAKNDNLLAMQEELARLELESKRLELKEKQLNLEDIQDRLDERKTKRDTIRQTSLTNGATLKSLAEVDRMVQKRCNHRKGGNGAAGVVGGQGDSADYSVIKHIMLNSDMWIRCTRCGKTWKPPVKEHFDTVEEYLRVFAEYEAAKAFQTKNSTSSSQQFRFSDNGAYFREITRYTNLR